MPQALAALGLGGGAAAGGTAAGAAGGAAAGTAGAAGGAAAASGLTAAEAALMTAAQSAPIGGSATLGAGGGITTATGAAPLTAANVSSGAVGSGGIGAASGGLTPVQQALVTGASMVKDSKGAAGAGGAAAPGQFNPNIDPSTMKQLPGGTGTRKTLLQGLTSHTAKDAIFGPATSKYFGADPSKIGAEKLQTAGRGAYKPAMQANPAPDIPNGMREGLNMPANPSAPPVSSNMAPPDWKTAEGGGAGTDLAPTPEGLPPESPSALDEMLNKFLDLKDRVVEGTDPQGNNVAGPKERLTRAAAKTAASLGGGGGQQPSMTPNAPVQGQNTSDPNAPSLLEMILQLIQASSAQPAPESRGNSGTNGIRG